MEKNIDPIRIKSIKSSTPAKITFNGGNGITLTADSFDFEYAQQQYVTRGNEAMLEYYRENLEEHNENKKHLEYHTKESVINLYKDVLRLANELMKVVAE